jgi:2-methylisocitrate lyase-like PEP mutase family enzyme
VTRDEAIEHAAALQAATPLPVNADLESPRPGALLTTRIQLFG